MDSRSKKTLSVDLDGNCGFQSPIIDSQTGKVYATSDALTLYAITQDGRVQWTLKQACKNDRFSVYPLPNDDLIVACTNQALYTLRGGKPLWTATLGASGGWSWSGMMLDGSGSIYVGARGPAPSTDLIAFDKLGRQVWKVSTGKPSEDAKPLGFDTQGRLYVSVSHRIVSLSQ
jgi:hypothetical protein